jgi:hypothetical protein
MESKHVFSISTDDDPQEMEIKRLKEQLIKLQQEKNELLTELEHTQKDRFADSERFNQYVHALRTMIRKRTFEIETESEKNSVELAELNELDQLAQQIDCFLFGLARTIPRKWNEKYGRYLDPDWIKYVELKKKFEGK